MPQPGNEAGFLHKVDIELKRAERYRVFVSLLMLDLSDVGQEGTDGATATTSEILRIVETNIRVIDAASVVGKDRLVLLLPETSRQGAELAARRLSSLIQKNLSKVFTGSNVSKIPVEMASYPDAAGARTVKDILQEMSESNVN